MSGDLTGGGNKSGKKATNADINMIPFIDLLMVTLAFLLITAVWVTFSRMNANAQVPGPPNPEREVDPQTPEKVLHLHILESEFSLVWKQGANVISESKVAKPDQSEDKFIRYSDLQKKLGEEWKVHGGHQDKSDTKRDQAVLHADNTLKFREIIAVLDALYATQREMTQKAGTIEQTPVFNMTFSVR